MTTMAMNNIPLRNVRLYGALGARFGRKFSLAVQTPAEAVRALCYLLPGFRRYLTEAKDKGMLFGVLTGDKHVPESELTMPGHGDIRIAPIPAGSGRAAGVFMAIVGIVLIVVGAWTGNIFLVGMGISMILGGVVMMLAPVPNDKKQKDTNNEPNYAFNGPVNTQAQGNPVPLLYGRMKIGSAVISAGILSDDAVYIPINADPVAPPPTGGGDGGGACVSCDAFLPDGRRASEVMVGDYLVVVDPITLQRRAGQVTYSQAAEVEAVRLRTECGVELTCSRTAPIPTLSAAFMLAPDMLGLETLVSRNGELAWSRVVDIIDVGLHRVQHITCENACFLAGDEAGRFMLHHNTKPHENFDEFVENWVGH